MRKLESCMYIYLDKFLDIHRYEYPQHGNMYGTDGIKAVLEVSYLMICIKLQSSGLLNSADAINYLLGRE